jgi:thiamine-phosphate pyrophosphorylase
VNPLEEHLSAGASRVLAAARRRAATRQASHVEPLDLLAGLIADEDSGSFQLLVKHGPTLEELQARVGVAVHEQTDDLPPLPLDSVARRIVARGREISLGRVGDLEVGTEDLLIALLDVWSDAEPFLESHGFSHASIRNERSEPEPGNLSPDPSEPSLAFDFDAEVVPRARLIDANLNRASEGFRVAEDYTRFVLEDRALSERLKLARHRLQEAAAFLPDSWRVTTRDVPNDVGVELTTDQEGRRETMLSVAVANIKRVQEALRSLEEASKIDNSLAARQFGAIRYEAYHLEKLLRVATAANQALASADVYWLTEPDVCRKTFEWTANEVLDAGVVLIQLRQKDVDDRTLLAMAERLRRWTERYGARLIINDRADVARVVGADGVHVGQEDLPAAEIRRVVGPEALIGVSTHSLADLEKAILDGADYVGIGPVFPSRTKSFEKFPGLDFVRAAVSATSLPAFCIGGITPKNIDEVFDAGGRRVAVGRAISESEEPAQIVRRLRTALADP